MARTQRGPIDFLSGYTLIDPTEGDPPQEDYYVLGAYTIWGAGLITFGPPTAEQQAWMENLASNSDLSTFPTDWVSFGFSGPYIPGELEIWSGGTWISGVLINEQGIEGASAWSIGGLTGTGLFYWSDLNVTDGTEVGETLTGSDSQETLNGLQGDDTLIGGGGSDALHGGEGNDHLIGGDGVDRLWGDSGDDMLEPGSDAAFNHLGLDLNTAGVHSVDGGSGFDTLVLDYSASDSSQSLDGAVILSSAQVTNVEAVAITGSQFSDVLSGGASDDRLFGGGGFDVLNGGGGNDLLDAGAPGASSVGAIGEGGRSTADALSLDYLFTAGSGLPRVSFSFTQTETSVADWGVRPLAGNFYSFTVDQAGAQAFIDYTIDATGGFADFDFVITDENGLDVPAGFDPAVPIVFPHAGTYYLRVDAFNTNVWAFATIDVTLSLEGAQVLTTNVLSGGDGNDTYIVHSTSDQVIEAADAGIDTVRSSVGLVLGANVENLTLLGSAVDGTGNALDNVLLGNSAGNVLGGGAGNDIIGGGAGADVLNGGSGRDIYVFTDAELGTSMLGPHDVIADFQRGDKIDISALYEDAAFRGLKAGKASDVASLSGFKAVTYVENGKTYLSGDTDGIAGADFTIELGGSIKLNASDLIVAARDWDRATGGLDYEYHHNHLLWV